MAPTRVARQATAPKLSRGVGAKNGVALPRLAGVQRARMLGAMVDLACERGGGNVTVAQVVERSGVSRRTFYETFEDRDECFRAGFDDALERARARVAPAYREADGWRARVRAGLTAFLAFLDEQPRAGRLLVCESAAGGRAVLTRRGEIVALLTRIVEEGRSESKVMAEVPPLAGEGVVGGALAVIQSRLLSAPRIPLIELTNPLMSMIVSPYLGASAARRELDRAVKASPAIEAAPSFEKDPFKETGMRLTYRTVRVLFAVADHPGASNRVIGEIAGMNDQGQISKLLARLSRLGLVANSGLGRGTGGPNKWILTETGRRMADTIRANASEDLQ